MWQDKQERMIALKVKKKKKKKKKQWGQRTTKTKEMAYFLSLSFLSLPPFYPFKQSVD
jgi:hypothetical protein